MGIIFQMYNIKTLLVLYCFLLINLVFSIMSMAIYDPLLVIL